MKLISATDIEQLDISPLTAIQWVNEAFLMKDRCQLPAKISVHPQGNDFFTAMPCLLPDEYHRFGCKIVSRIKGNHPSLRSNLMLFDSRTGQMLALIDADWITAMRTGAVAALSVNTLAVSSAKTIAVIGLGVVGNTALRCILESRKGLPTHVRLLRYKDQADKTARLLAPPYQHDASFSIVDTIPELVDGADVVISAITDADRLLVDDTTLFKPGVLVLPIHTRGFQNCDTIFDRVFADDRSHVCNFRYFDHFRHFAELTDVLSGRDKGRTSDDERILGYNIGIGLHDVYFASRIYDLISQADRR